jgi:hypothetical protein
MATKNLVPGRRPEGRVPIAPAQGNRRQAAIIDRAAVSGNGHGPYPGYLPLFQGESLHFDAAVEVADGAGRFPPAAADRFDATTQAL